MLLSPAARRIHSASIAACSSHSVYARSYFSVKLLKAWSWLQHKISIRCLTYVTCLTSNSFVPHRNPHMLSACQKQVARERPSTG